MKALLEQSGTSFLMLNADEPDVRELLQEATSTRLRGFSRMMPATPNDDISNRNIDRRIHMKYVPTNCIY